MPSTGHDRPDQRTLLFRQRIPHQRAAKVVLDRLAMRMEHVEPFRPLLGLVDHAGDTSKLTRQADIEPEAGSPQSRSQSRERARRPAGEQITVCLGPYKKLITDSSREGIPFATGQHIVIQW